MTSRRRPITTALAAAVIALGGCGVTLAAAGPASAAETSASPPASWKCHTSYVASRTGAAGGCLHAPHIYQAVVRCRDGFTGIEHTVVGYKNAWGSDSRAYCDQRSTAVGKSLRFS